MAADEGEMTQELAEEEDFGTRSKVSLLDQHSELKKKAEGINRVIYSIITMENLGIRPFQNYSYY